jgi:HEXXH motif-containing protein
VHLPGLGALYLDQGVSSGAPAESLQLRTCPGQAPTLWRESQQVPAVLRTRRTVPGTELELYEELHPFFASCFRQRPSDHEVEVAATTRRSLPALTRALELLGRVAPGLLAQLRRDGRALVVLQSDKVSSMASLATYGLVFISVPEEPSELFFGEELVHQISHVSFYAVTAQPCFTIPSETPLSRFTVLAADHRTMFTAFHGNYTIMRMAQFFDACLEGGTPSEPLRHELIGRFALALARFEAGLIAIDDERLYTPIAWRLHRRMIEVYEDLDARHRKLIEGYDLTNQPYVFDYPAFCSRNPCEGTRSLSSRSS